MTHIPNDDEINAFFSSITPESVTEEPEYTFIRTLDSPADLGDAESFEVFWLTQLGQFRSLGKHFTALHDGQKVYYYAHRPDESDWDYISRVTEDAKRLGARWTFVCYAGRAARGASIDSSAPDAHEQLEGKLVDCTLWYAGAKDHERVHGIVHGDDFVVSSNPKGVNPRFLDILAEE